MDANIILGALRLIQREFGGSLSDEGVLAETSGKRETAGARQCNCDLVC